MGKTTLRIIVDTGSFEMEKEGEGLVERAKTLLAARPLLSGSPKEGCNLDFGFH